MKRSATLTFLSLATLSLTICSNAKAETILTCRSVTAVQPNGQKSIIPVAFEVTQTADEKTTTVSSNFGGKLASTTDVNFSESDFGKEDPVKDLVKSLAPDTDANQISKGVFVELPNGMNNDAPITLIDLRKENGESLVTLVEIAGGAVMGSCTK